MRLERQHRRLTRTTFAAATMAASVLFAPNGVRAEWITTAPRPSMVSPDNTYLVPSSPDGGYVSQRALTAATVENNTVNEQVREINARRAAELDPRGGDWCKTHELNSLASTLRCASQHQQKDEAPRNAAQGIGPSMCDRIESAAQRRRCGK